MSKQGVARSWGAWTEIKLDALSGYLPAFNRASSSAKGTLYLDLFAGTSENTSRLSGEKISGSALRALAASPAFAKVVLCEMHTGKAASLRTAVAEQHPERDVDVLDEDCNVAIPRHLNHLAVLNPGWRRAPAFAFVDQYSAEIHWDTLRYLSEYRANHPKGYKTELWLYLGESFIVRGLGQKDQAARDRYARRVDKMFGTTRWREIWQGRVDGLLTESVALNEYVNLMRWRLEHELGYATTIALKMTETRGNGLYTMIFATSTDAGNRIMTHILRGAEKEQHEMVARAKRARQLHTLDKRVGAIGLPGMDEAAMAMPFDDGPAKALLQLGPAVTPWEYPAEPSARSSVSQ